MFVYILFYLSKVRNVHDVKVNVFFSSLRQEACSGLLPPGLVPAEHVHGAVPLGEGLGHAVADAGVGARHAGDLAVHVLPYVRTYVCIKFISPFRKNDNERDTVDRIDSIAT